MAGVEEQFRRRVAYLLAGIGLFFLLTGIALVVDNHFDIKSREAPVLPHVTQAHTTQPASQPAALARAKAQASAIQRFLFWLLVLVGIFALGSLALLRWSRSYRKWILHEPATPTPAEDVWAMHRLPGEAASSEEPAPPHDEPPPERAN